MRKWIALFTIILTYYIAGMFHSRILLTAALMEGFLFILMFVLSRYLSARFSVHAGSGECHTSKNSEAVLLLRCRNDSPLPVSRFRIRLETCPQDGKRAHPLTFFGSAGPKEERMLECRITPDHCGIVNVNLKQWTLYDYFAWFHKKEHPDETIRIFSYPAAGPARIDIADLSDRDSTQEHSLFTTENRPSGEDIRQIREYHPGDLLRNVHWKVSAKMGGLWMKEYEMEGIREITFGIHLSETASWKPEEADCFYEILSSLLQNLLKQNLHIQVRIWDKHGWNTDIPVLSPDDLSVVFTALYQLPEPSLESPEGSARTVYQMEEADLLFDRTLTLYRRGEAQYRFSKEHYLEELSGTVPVSLV